MSRWTNAVQWARDEALLSLRANGTDIGRPHLGNERRSSLPTHCAAMLLLLVVGMSSPAWAQSADEVARANNPLAPITAINLQNYSIPSIYGVDDPQANALLLRPVIATERLIFRGTLPVSTVPTSDGSVSGLGDFSAFLAFLLPSRGAWQLGVGPLVAMPTATDDALGTGKWQLGVAAVAVSNVTPTLLAGALVTWQGSVGGDDDRPDASLLTAQPLAIMQIGAGYYIRSTGVIQVNTENGDFAVPFGLGAGKVFRSGRAVLNAFLEPQWTVLHDGAGQPAFQLFAGLNIQFPSK